MTQPPSQRARDAAAEIALFYLGNGVDLPGELKSGIADRHFTLDTLQRFEANLKAEMVARVEGLREALVAVVDAVRDYLPPDGIDAQECLNRIIGAVDNPEINPVIREIEHGRS